MEDSHEPTLFEQVISRAVPADIVYEDDRCTAFRDINPQAPTHILLVPHIPMAKLSDVTADDKDLLGHLLFVVPQIIAKVCPGEDYRVVINNGVGAGQSVFHLHLHILAGRPLDWPPG